jgi:Fur family peroxide stress response transcriptional regulator
MRQTKQRSAVLRVLTAAEQHPTAEWVYQEVRKEIPDISLGTVYRLLHALEEEGLVHVLMPLAGPKRFDGCPGPHNHLICTACGSILDVPNLLEENAKTEIERWTEYTISHVRLEWFGLCPRCRESQP